MNGRAGGSDDSAGAEFAPREVELRNGRRVLLRPVRPEDRDAMLAAFNRLSPESRYARFLWPIRQIPPEMLERAANPVPGREFVLVATVPEEGSERIVGGARYFGIRGTDRCEFAITVEDAWHAVGLGEHLVTELATLAAADGFRHMEGHVLAGNSAMLGLARKLGFRTLRSSEGPGVVLIRLEP